MKYMKPCSSFSPSDDDDDGNLLPYNSRSRRNEGCIGRILRRILCVKSIPSCPFDRRREEDEKGLSVVGSSASTPGIVARLMGLESVPLIESIVRSPSRNSFRKSRSPNGKYLRINIPTYQELGDENFFILSFEQGDQESMDSFSMDRRKSHLINSDKKKHALGAKCKKIKAGRESLQEWNKENQGVYINNENVSEKVLDSGMDNFGFKAKNSSNVLSSPLKNSAEKRRKKKVKQDKKKEKHDSFPLIKLETEGHHDSENSSPNSVLDFVEYDKPYTDTANSAGDASRLANSKLRRTLSEELKNYENFKAEKLLINNGCGEEQQTSLRNRNKKSNSTYKWDEIRKLAEREMIKSSWVQDEASKTRHYFKEIGRDVASEILDQLLFEQLINFP